MIVEAIMRFQILECGLNKQGVACMNLKGKMLLRGDLPSGASVVSILFT